MTPAQFEQLVRDSGFKPLDKRHGRHGAILLAERKTYHSTYRFKNSIEPKPYWEMLYGIERDGMDMAQIIRMDDTKMVRGVIQKVPQAERIAEVVKEAEQFIEDNLEVGRYDD